MRGMPSAVRPMKVKGSSGVTDYLSIRDAAGLVALVQFGVIELHPWGSKPGDLERADRLVFDLDPDAAVEWPAVVAAATQIRARLKAVGLESFLKTSGGKGLHVVAPLNPGIDWAVAKAFSQALAVALANEQPEAFVAKMSKAARRGRSSSTTCATSVALPRSPRIRFGRDPALPSRCP